MKLVRRGFVGLMTACVLAACGPADPSSRTVRVEAPPEAPPVRVFAAASLTDVMEEIALAWMAAGHAGPVVNLAGSSTLARQISDGAEADIFISADEQWMDWVGERSLIDSDSRKPLLGNSLVLVTGPAETWTVALESGADLAGALGDGRIALADPEAVPAGRYAKEALTALGMWATVAPKVVSAEDVRAALRFVTTGEADAAIVYATDARAAGEQVRIVGTFPEGSHTPIVYPVALTAEAAGSDEARAMLDFLSGPEARAVFEARGFTVLGGRE
jgi:molybdate transport system substrate-binding protein